MYVGSLELGENDIYIFYLHDHLVAMVTNGISCLGQIFVDGDVEHTIDTATLCTKVQ